MPKAKSSTQVAAFPVVPFLGCPAKTFFNRNTGKTHPGRSVFEHCLIVGEVARGLQERFRLLLPELLPEEACIEAACHDIGKVSPFFYEKIRRACDSGDLSCLGDIDPTLEKQWGGHAGVSLVAAEGMGLAPLLAEVIGQHHGFRPNVSAYTANSEVFGGQAWQAERIALVQALKNALRADWPGQVTSAQARLLAGLTSVADWIGSGPLFEDPATDWSPLISEALDSAGFVSPQIIAGLSFPDIFGFSPNSIQECLIEQISGPGVYILEAPMGQGKTEAALYAAYRQLVSGKANGIYFALPTQLTSNKLYERFDPFLQHILHPQCIHRKGLLLHGQAWLMQAQMGEEGCPGGAWFHHAKRGLLAPFAVGTVDQALMAVMNVRHGFVRAFGLAGKVVILDEVHSYDLYTGTILQQLIGQLREWGCTVIILSATLTRSRREQLLQHATMVQVYPLISALPTQVDCLREIVVPPPPSRTVHVQLLHEDLPALEEALRRAEQGEQVLWVENSVADAQTIYQTLSARTVGLGIACGLLHSRFTRLHRQQNEDKWVKLFGKPGWPERNLQGRILVGTQVLEQSLDIDADFLVSRFAPTDLLLQRLGRLWRHANAPRAASAKPEAFLLAPDLEPAIIDPYAAFGASAAVYSPYVLCRSLQSWQSVSELGLPQDIRLLLEETYADQLEQGEMARWRYELENGETRRPYLRPGTLAMQRLALATLAASGSTQPDVNVATRYSEQDSLDTLLLRHAHLQPERRYTALTLLDGRIIELPHRRESLTPAQWRDLSIILQRETLSLSAHTAPPASPRKRLEQLGLQHVFHLGHSDFEDALLRVALVDEQDRIITLDHQTPPGRHAYRYRDDLGYQRLSHKD